VHGVPQVQVVPQWQTGPQLQTGPHDSEFLVWSFMAISSRLLRVPGPPSWRFRFGAFDRADGPRGRVLHPAGCPAFSRDL